MLHRIIGPHSEFTVLMTNSTFILGLVGLAVVFLPLFLGCLWLKTCLARGGHFGREVFWVR